MVDQILNLFVYSAQNVGLWFTKILQATGMESTYLIYLFVFFSTSIILVPIIGGRIRSPLGSDRARRRSFDE